MKLLVVLLFSAACFADVDRITDYTEQHKRAVPDGCEPWVHSRFEASHREHKGVGYNKGYTSGIFFFTPRWDKDYQPFLDLRAHVFNDGYFASNIGVGSRFVNNDNSRIYGVNAYFDHRGWKHLEANQFGAGFEMLTRWVDFRFNGYWPFGKNYETGPFKFAGFNNNGVRVTQQIQYAFPAVDTDIGGVIPLFGNYSQLELGVGSYYLFRQNAPRAHAGNAWGAKARASFDWSKWLSIGVDWSYDRIYHGRTNGFIALRTSFGLKKKQRKMPLPKTYCQCSDYYPMIRKRLAEVKRMEIIPMLNKTQHLNGVLNENIIFVDNLAQGVGAGVLSASVGNGTYQNPYNTLAQAQSASTAGDIIYVFYGDGSTSNQNTGFAMKAGQTLQGSDVGFTIGDVFVPPQTPGSRPKITNTGGVGVTLADDTTINGLEIVSPTSTPVAGTSITNATVRNCTLTAVQESAGIYITGLTGSAVISNNTISSPGRPSSSLSGVEFVNAANVGSLVISNNQINSGFENGIAVSWTNVGTGTTSIGGNTIINGDVTYGVVLGDLPLQGTLYVSDNQINCSRSDGFPLLIEGGSATHETFTSYILNNNMIGTNGIMQIWQFFGDLLTCSIENNTFSIGVTSYFPILIQPVSDSNVTFKNNVASVNSTAEDGITFNYFTTSSKNGTLNISNNVLTQNSAGGDALRIDSLGNDSLDIVCQNNTAITQIASGGIVMNSNYAPDPPNTCIVYTGNTASAHLFNKSQTGGTLKIKGANGTQAGIEAANPVTPGGLGFSYAGAGAATITYGTTDSSCP